MQRVAPWLPTDANPYPAVVQGRIVWIVDAYTTLDTYPYAQHSTLEGSVTSASGVVRTGNKVSYVRNSVKATVDAYDGTVTLYQVDSARSRPAGVDARLSRHREIRARHSR